MAITIRAQERRRGLSKASLVQEELRKAIIGLQLAPGARIDKPAICSQLGVSRQPVTDALARLAEERLVEVEPQKGTFVARIRLHEVIEASFVRQALEAATVRAIAPDIDDATLQLLSRNLAYQAAAERSDDNEGFYAFDAQFHAILFARLASQRVADIVESSRGLLERARRLLLPKPGRNSATMREHRQIFEALAARDPASSAAAMRHHLRCGIEELKDFAAERPDLFEP